MPREKGGGARRVSIYPVLLVNFIGTLGYSIILPFLIFLVTRLGGGPLLYGLLGATYPIFQLFGAPILGRWSDFYGRRRILLLSQGGTAIAWLVFCVALFLPATALLEIGEGGAGTSVLTLPLAVLFLARALDGVTGGNVSVANAYLADITERKDRTKNFGKMAGSSNLGFVAGPLLASVLGASALGELLPALVALGISVAATAAVALLLPETNPSAIDPGPSRPTVCKTFGQEHRDCVVAAEPERLHWSDVLGIQHVAFMLVLYFLIFLGFNFFYTAFPVHVVSSLGWSVKDTGVFFAFLSLMMVIVQGPVLARLSKRFSEAVLIVLGNVLLGANFLLIASGDTTTIYLAAGLFAFGNGVMWPSVLSLLSKLTGDRHQGAVQGFAGSLGSLASIIGLIAGGALYPVLGSGTFVVSAITIFAAAVLSLRLLGIQRGLDRN